MGYIIYVFRYEHFGSDLKRTVINKFVSSICWTGIELSIVIQGKQFIGSINYQTFVTLAQYIAQSVITLMQRYNMLWMSVILKLSYILRPQCYMKYRIICHSIESNKTVLFKELPSSAISLDHFQSGYATLDHWPCIQFYCRYFNLLKKILDVQVLAL